MDRQHIISFINNLSDFDKIGIYMHYYIVQLGLKHDFALTNDGCPYRYLWKDIPIKSLKEFFSPTNIRIIDNGEDWKKQGSAERIRTDYFGAYDWLWKFQKDIKRQ